MDRLFPFENPLLKRPGPDFFRALPKGPGVYFFVGDGETILYVGKAKNLRNRLNSYKRAHPDTVSRKVIRLLIQTREIRFEECASEAEALLKENSYLRTLKPFYNSVNTQPESYFFLALRMEPLALSPSRSRIELRLTTRPESEGRLPHHEFFGAFKSRKTIREGYGALLRLLWLMSAEVPLAERLAHFSMPARLLRYRSPAQYTFEIPAAWRVPLRRYLRGTGPRFLVLLTERLLLDVDIPPFYYALIQQDLEHLRNLYARCLQRNRSLFRKHELEDEIIAQDAIDDLLVREQVRLGKVQDTAP